MQNIFRYKFVVYGALNSESLHISFNLPIQCLIFIEVPVGFVLIGAESCRPVGVSPVET